MQNREFENNIKTESDEEAFVIEGRNAVLEDNRLKFLYCLWTELWGRRRRARAGNGKAGTSV